MIDTLKNLFHGDEKYFNHHNSTLDENYYLQNCNYQRKKNLTTIPSDKILRKDIFSSLYHENYIYGQLLKMILKSKKNKHQKLTKKEMIEKAREILNIYTWKSGGYSLDSKSWKEYDRKNKYYAFSKDTLGIFVNTTNKIDIDSAETHEFLYLIISAIKKLSHNYTAGINKFYDKTENVVEIVLCIETD